MDARQARDRYLLDPIRQLVDERVGAAEQVTREEIAELRRIVGDHGDAADDVAEVFGRTLARLSAEVGALSEELARLRSILDRLAAAGGIAAGPPAQGALPLDAPR
ncbi:hypothetical protein K6U06_14405 [Acidiferrimicrobium sp. IK]|uniref:hypothetical protein n=1 Tax=Acidiferrimicrobium sp. IK TaxID=2871700 RepID=UPI0021CB58E4|nr:hypothetical protein [Acidiferrimicrobium sp. IK]MCU4185557.1 hypothetical protein [Acidiferrimicrobium sp. IK]